MDPLHLVLLGTEPCRPTRRDGDDRALVRSDALEITRTFIVVPLEAEQLLEVRLAEVLACDMDIGAGQGHDEGRAKREEGGPSKEHLSTKRTCPVCNVILSSTSHTGE